MTQLFSIDPLFQANRILPLRCRYPFDYTISPYYELLYVSHIVIQLVIVVEFVVFSSFVLSMAFLLGSQYDILCCSLKNLVPTTLQRINSPETVVRLRFVLYLSL